MKQSPSEDKWSFGTRKRWSLRVFSQEIPLKSLYFSRVSKKWSGSPFSVIWGLSRISGSLNSVESRENGLF